MRKIAEGLKFSEGPVFDKNGHFFMVAARSMDPLSGYVLNVNLNNGNVSDVHIIIYLSSAPFQSA